MLDLKSKQNYANRIIIISTQKTLSIIYFRYLINIPIQALITRWLGLSPLSDFSSLNHMGICTLGLK